MDRGLALALPVQAADPDGQLPVLAELLPVSLGPHVVGVGAAVVAAHGPGPARVDAGGDAEFVRTRWHAGSHAAFAAVREGRLVGSNFLAHWGSVGFFGPLTVDPECWGQGIAQRLLEPTVELFDSWGTRHVGLFTFAQSALHVGLY
jgi:GNAT superfamily N-acetyltransferase